MPLPGRDETPRAYGLRRFLAALLLAGAIALPGTARDSILPQSEPQAVIEAFFREAASGHLEAARGSLSPEFEPPGTGNAWRSQLAALRGARLMSIVPFREEFWGPPDREFKVVWRRAAAKAQPVEKTAYVRLITWSDSPWQIAQWSAAVPPPRVDAIPYAIEPGRSVAVRGVGFPPGAPLAVTLGMPPGNERGGRVLARGRANRNGSVRLVFTVPPRRTVAGAAGRLVLSLATPDRRVRATRLLALTNR